MTKNDIELENKALMNCLMALQGLSNSSVKRTLDNLMHRYVYDEIDMGINTVELISYPEIGGRIKTIQILRMFFSDMTLKEAVEKTDMKNLPSRFENLTFTEANKLNDNLNSIGCITVLCNAGEQIDY